MTFDSRGLDSYHAVRQIDFQVIGNGSDHDGGFFSFHLQEPDLDEQPYDFHQVVAFLRVHAIKKHYRQLKTLVELTDDVVSTFYAPNGGDEAQIFGLYSLSNILEPRVGVMQMFGVRGFGRTREEAMAHARRDVAALQGALEGKFRQIVLKPLNLEETTIYYRHLSRCRRLGAILGNPVPRLAAGLGDMDMQSRIQVQEQQEQMEVVATACADVPFQVLIWVDPLSFDDVNHLLLLTSKELSKWASEIKGSKNMSLSAMIPSLFAPTFSFAEGSGQQLQMLSGADHRYLNLHSDLQRLQDHSRVSDAHTNTGEQTQYAGVERSQEGSHEQVVSGMREHVSEASDVVSQTDRVSDLRWHTQRHVSQTEVGNVSESQRLTEHQDIGEKVHQVDDAAWTRDSDLSEHITEHEVGERQEHIEDSYSFAESSVENQDVSYAGVQTSHVTTAGSQSVRGASAAQGYDHQAAAYRDEYGGRQAQGMAEHQTHNDVQVTSERGSESQQATYGDQHTTQAGGDFQRNEAYGEHGAGAARESYSRRETTSYGGEDFSQTEAHRDNRGDTNEIGHTVHDGRGGNAGVSIMGASVSAREFSEDHSAQHTQSRQVLDESGTQRDVSWGAASHEKSGGEASSHDYSQTGERGVMGDFSSNQASDTAGQRQEQAQYASQGVRTESGQSARNSQAVTEVAGRRAGNATNESQYQQGQAYQDQQQTQGQQTQTQSVSGSYSQTVARSIAGSGQRVDDVTRDWVQDRTIDRQTQAHLAATEHRLDDVTRQIGRDVVTTRGIERAYVAQTETDVDEVGHTIARLRELAHVQSRAEVDRTRLAMQESARYSDAVAVRRGVQGALTERQSHVEESSAQAGREVVSGPTRQAGNLLSMAALSTRASGMLSGFGMSGMPYLIASMGKSVQTVDEAKRLHVDLLTMQRERLKAGRDTGLFHTTCFIAAYNDEDLVRLGRAMVAALREEGTVSAVQVRLPDDEEQAADWYQHLRCLHPCPQREQWGVWEMSATGTLQLSNDLAAMVHPLRTDAHGGISTTIEAIPTSFHVPANMRGETCWGRIVSPATGRLTGNEFRVGYRDLMHLVVVGGSGSGKSNAAQHILSEIMNRIRVDERGEALPAPTRPAGPYQLARLAGDHGRPRLGATVFDPGGDWRRLLRLVDPREVEFYTLYDPDFRPLYINPLRIPSPYITPDVWAEVVAKRWAIAYATGSTGFHAIRQAIMDLYRETGVYNPRLKHTDAGASRGLRMTDLRRKLSEARYEKGKARSKQDISVGVLDRILEKMWAFSEEAGGAVYRMFSQHEGTTVDAWMPENRLTLLEGTFEDDNLKTFVISLMATACFLHAKGRYAVHHHDTEAFAPHILVFEEAHEIMEAESEGRQNATMAVETGATIWNKILDQGRKYGLHIWASGQRLLSLPAGFLANTRIFLALGIDDEKDIRAAVTKLGKVTSAMTEDLPWMRFFQQLEVGRAAIKFSRMSSRQQMQPVLVWFPEVRVKPPTNGEIDYILGLAPWLFADPQTRSRIERDLAARGRPLAHTIVNQALAAGAQDPLVMVRHAVTVVKGGRSRAA